MVLPSHPNFCLLHLIVRLKAYHAQGHPARPFLITLVKPHSTMSRDCVGVLTKHILEAHGVDVSHYKPHTTQGVAKLNHK